ncbi:hypothetical protein [Sulfitobacter sediminilitoris]|uniref:hypothetical protein n=1 Tax=Sulfitobacter sediminilitoris TaxID=2698830 RepID=UPI001F21613A|nr:hypothetical protein [Sulfitobacter sediminilitoris]
MLDFKKRKNIEPGIAKRSTVDPAKMSTAERAELMSQLYALNQKIFAGVSPQDFENHVLDASADSTLIQLFFAADGQFVGYCAAHRFWRQVLGRHVIVLRAEAGLLSEYRGHGATYRFRMIRSVAEKLRHPFTPIYYVGTLVHASSYDLACQNFPQVYPHPDRETPEVIQEVAREVINSFPAPPVSEADPFVRDVGWTTIEVRQENAPGRHEENHYVRFSRRVIPAMRRGMGW